MHHMAHSLRPFFVPPENFDFDGLPTYLFFYNFFIRLVIAIMMPNIDFDD